MGLKIRKIQRSHWAVLPDLPISDDLLALHIARPGTPLAAGLRAGAPGTLDPLGRARVAGAGLVGRRLHALVAEAAVYFLQLLARTAGHLTVLDA